VIVAASLAAATDVSTSGSDSTPHDIVESFPPGQRVRVQTEDYRMLGGHFARAAGDSLLLRSSWGDAGEGGGEDVVRLSEVRFLWRIDDHGIGRGLLWAGGTLLVGGAITLGAAPDKIDGVGEATVFVGITAAATVFAFYRGISGSKETLVYSRY
jgi:hypothetical protein